MREIVKDFVRLCNSTLPLIEPIYNFGSRSDAEYPDDVMFFKVIYAGKEYYGADMREGYGVDKILDMHELDLPDNSVGTVLCLDTLEHVEYLRKAMREIHRVLKPEGFFAVITLGWDLGWLIHECPKDYWRFTPDAIKSILELFTTSFIAYAGDKKAPHTVAGVALKRPLERETAEKLEKNLMEWSKKYVNNR